MSPIKWSPQAADGGGALFSVCILASTAPSPSTPSAFSLPRNAFLCLPPPTPPPPCTTLPDCLIVRMLWDGTGLLLAQPPFWVPQMCFMACWYLQPAKQLLSWPRSQLGLYSQCHAYIFLYPERTAFASVMIHLYLVPWVRGMMSKTSTLMFIRNFLKVSVSKYCI